MIEPLKSSFPWAQDVGRTVDLGSCRLHLADEGSGPPVLLLHGWGRTYATWNQLGPELAKRRRVLAPDLPGLGYSTRPSPPARTLDRHADLMLKLLDSEGIGKIAIVANSLGAGVAMQMALTEPDRIDLLVLLAPIGYRTPVHFGVKAIGKGGVLGRFLWWFMTPRRLSKRIDALFGLHSDLVPSRDRIESELVGVRNIGGGGPGLVDALAASTQDLAWRVDELEPPTLVICGTEDHLVPAQLGSDLAAALPEGQFEAVFQVGHFPHEEQPETVLDLITTFLAGRENRRGPDNFSLVVDGT